MSQHQSDLKVDYTALHAAAAAVRTASGQVEVAGSELTCRGALPKSAFGTLEKAPEWYAEERESVQKALENTVAGYEVISEALEKVASVLLHLDTQLALEAARGRHR